MKDVPKEKKNKGKKSDKLGELRSDLYKRDESSEILKRVKALSTPPRLGKRNKRTTVRPQLVNVLKERTKVRKRIWVWIGVAVLAAVVFVIAALGTVWYRNSRQVTQAQMGVSIAAATEHTAGESIMYTVTYENGSRVAWQNVEILFDVPDGFQYESGTPESTLAGKRHLFAIGALGAGESGQVEVRGKLIGEQGQSALARAELALSPENFPKARFTKSETFSTEIVAVPLEVAIQADAEAGNGERMIVEFVVKNTSDSVINGAHLRITPGVGLQLAPEDEEFSAEYSVLDSWWELPAIEPLSEVSRKAVILVSGTAGEKRTITAEGLVRQEEQLYLLREVNHVVTVSASELSVIQTFDESEESIVVVPEQKIKAKIDYANVGTVGLKNVVVSVEFEGTGFNAESLELTSGGAYNPKTEAITWTAASIPELATVLPGQKGVLEYEFEVAGLDVFPEDEEGTNQNLIAVATIDSTDLPAPVGQERKVITDRFVMPIGTELTLETSAFYDDGRLGLASSGPTPPKVGEETTYTVRFRLGSTLNDVGEVRLSAILPDGVSYTDNVFKTEGEVDFNDRTGEITWLIPKVNALSGRAAPGPELHVQVSITPGDNLRGEIVSLVQSVSVEGLDIFSEETAKTVEDELPTTETAKPGEGEVEVE